MKIVALIGKAGSGKDTLLHSVMEAFPERFNEIISCTTRPPREGEVHGKNYFFLTIEQFTEKLLNGDLLEATEFNDWHYGTLYSTLSKDKINIGVFNPEGVINLLESKIDIDVWYIIADNKTRLIRQLNREQFPNVEEIIRRYSTDEQDFAGIEKEIPALIVFENMNKEDIELFVDLIGQEY